MEKGSGGGGLLGWTGLVGLIVGVAVGAAVGYLEVVRRAEVHDMGTRLQLLQAEIVFLRNTTEHLHKQIQAQEKRIEDDKTPQYYDDNTDYYDDDSYDDYRDGEDPEGAVPEPASSRNRTRRTLLEELLHSVHQRDKRAVESGSDKYNLIISQGPRRPSSPRGGEDVKALVIIDPKKEHVRPPTVVRPVYPGLRPHHTGTTRRPRVLYQARPPQEQVFRQETVPNVGTKNCCSATAAHFGANSTRVRHDHGGRCYDGESHTNHRMCHPGGLLKDWTPHAWSGDFPSDFHIHDGILTVYTPGLYFVYAQIYYTDSHDMSGFKVLMNNHELLFQCSVTSISSADRKKRNSCYTGGLAKLQNRDTLKLVEMEGERYSVFEHTKSFFGLFRVADI